MCYSAQIWQSHRSYARTFGAAIDAESFADLFGSRLGNAKIKLAKALECAFLEPDDAQMSQIAGMVQDYRGQQVMQLEQELFKQRKRLADAQRTLLTKTTQAATDSLRIATHKVDWLLTKLVDVRRDTLHDHDARIYPGYYAPVMVMEGGKRVVKPMRYQCRPQGKPADYDTKYPGTYNARRDNLQGFWKGQFGYTHGLMVVNAFYEHVTRTTLQGAANQILEFRPRPSQDLLVACVWSRWTHPAAPELLSFAAITDVPPPEVSAAGHDRCIIPIQPDHIDAWLNPNPRDLAASYAILDDRVRPYFEHRQAA